MDFNSIKRSFNSGCFKIICENQALRMSVDVGHCSFVDPMQLRKTISSLDKVSIK